MIQIPYGGKRSTLCLNKRVNRMNVTHLSCSQCSEQYESGKLYNLCHKCSKPLLVHYDLKRAATTLTRTSLAMREANLWRYREVLPVDRQENLTTLGEGWTPLVHAKRLGERLGMNHLH